MSDAFERVLARIPYKTTHKIEHYMDVSCSIAETLKKIGKTKEDFAKMLGHKNLRKINNWLSGLHNFTLSEISLIEVTLGYKIVETWGIRKKVSQLKSFKDHEKLQKKLREEK